MLLSRSDLSHAPEKGQLVTVRDRHWLVKRVLASSLPIDVISPNQGLQHLVELASVEDDALGDELSVIWEIEPGARIVETANLPKPTAGKFDDPERLQTFLNAVSWGAVTSADSVKSGRTDRDYRSRIVRRRCRPLECEERDERTKQC